MNFQDFFTKYRFYIASFFIFFVWITFFDRSNLFKQYELKSKLNQLQKEKEYLKNELKAVQDERESVMGNINSIEKYAREKYYLKKEGETVFVIVDKNGKIIEE